MSDQIVCYIIATFYLIFATGFLGLIIHEGFFKEKKSNVVHYDPNRFPEKALKPEDISIQKGFSLWVMDNSAAIDTAGTPLVNAAEARKAAKWLNEFASWAEK